METFVVRLWRPGATPPDAIASGSATPSATLDEIHGLVEHPASGRRRPFGSSADLVAIVRAWRDEVAAEARFATGASARRARRPRR